MKKKIFCAALPLLLFSLSIPVSADDTIKVDMEELALDGNWVDDYLMPNEYHYYPIRLETPGKLNLKVQTFFSGGSYGKIEFLTGDYEVVNSWDSAYILGTKGKPETEYFEYYLDTGLYYLRINADSGQENQGNLRVNGSFKDYSLTEIEPNPDYHEAQALEENKNICGILTYGEEADYFTFTLDEKTEIEVVIHVDEGIANYKLYNEDLEKISEMFNPQGFVEKKLLEPGTYYALMEPASSSPGAVYNIKYRVAGKSYSDETEEEEH